ncbi:MAG: phosphotransferase [Terriglobales bacterium]
MHEVVRELMERDWPPAVVARVPLDGGALVAGFEPAGRQRLRWVAKVGYGQAACQRLRAEAAALRGLAAVAEQLQIPRLLAYREQGGGATARACLAQSGLAGARWRRRRAAAVLAWLRRFQELAPGPGPRPALQTLVATMREQCTTQVRCDPDLAPWLDWVAAQLPPESHAGAALAAPVHGDFWPGNVLWQPGGGVGVVDWGGWGWGSRLDDVLTWHTHPGLGEARLDPVLRQGEARRCLRAWAAAAGYDGAAARLAFYLFVARRVRWELGLDLQARRQAERRQARREWRAVLAALARQRYPDPFAARA